MFHSSISKRGIHVCIFIFTLMNWTYVEYAWLMDCHIIVICLSVVVLITHRKILSNYFMLKSPDSAFQKHDDRLKKYLCRKLLLKKRSLRVKNRKTENTTQKTRFQISCPRCFFRAGAAFTKRQAAGAGDCGRARSDHNRKPESPAAEEPSEEDTAQPGRNCGRVLKSFL